MVQMRVGVVGCVDGFVCLSFGVVIFWVLDSFVWCWYCVFVYFLSSGWVARGFVVLVVLIGFDLLVVVRFLCGLLVWV